jgi:hypothetical protein
MGFKARYTRPRSVGWDVDSWETANSLLSYLHPDKRAFAAFTLAGGGYVQCAGAKRRLTVEARIYVQPDRFAHYVFGRGALTGAHTHIECAVGPIEVDTSQVLEMRSARRIMRHFIETRSLHPDYTATDVTHRFES